jgi:hypothetical protein
MLRQTEDKGILLNYWMEINAYTINYQNTDNYVYKYMLDKYLELVTWQF